MKLGREEIESVDLQGSAASKLLTASLKSDKLQDRFETRLLSTLLIIELCLRQMRMFCIIKVCQHRTEPSFLSSYGQRRESDDSGESILEKNFNNPNSIGNLPGHGGNFAVFLNMQDLIQI